MAQTNVEEILAAVQKLPKKDREHLLKTLQEQVEPGKSISRSRKRDAPQDNSPYSRDRIPPTRKLEMQWLLDHPEFWHLHRGEHVALWGYEMIAVGKTRKEVIAEARRRGITFPFVQYLPTNEKEWLLGISNQPAAEN